MNTTIRLIGCSLLTLLIFALPCQAKDSPAVEEVKALIRQHALAFDSKAAKETLAFYDDNAIIMGTGQGELYIGKEAISNAINQFFSNFEKEDREVTSHQLQVNGNVAWSMSTITFTSFQGGKKSTYYLNLSRVMEKKNGSWVCVAEHFSNLVSE